MNAHTSPPADTDGVAIFTPADLAELLNDAHTHHYDDDPIPDHVARAWIALERHPDEAAQAVAAIEAAGDRDYLARLNLAKLAAVESALRGAGR